jgi:hypothetical protein
MNLVPRNGNAQPAEDDLRLSRARAERRPSVVQHP